MLLLNLYPIHKTKSNCLLNLNRFISIVNFGGEAGDRELPRRTFERHSGTGREGDIKSEEAGRGNWGTPGEEVVVVETEEVAGVETEKPAGDEVAADANKENTAEVEEQKESEDKGSDKEKHKDDKEDKAKKMRVRTTTEEEVVVVVEGDVVVVVVVEGDVVVVTGKVLLVVDSIMDVFCGLQAVNINEFLKPGEGENYYRGGGRGRGRGGRDGEGASGGGFDGYRSEAAPAIGDTAQFPSLGGK
ncbi:unnamed protein product [Brassica oleracea var. botrytis]|uniref:Hyaluronan/mRNA-binding protein domain-containing protein n=1 Tax=Brassica oleracea TaxID=3712 RepID=A0A3P6C5B4_BRAOL|nr:unnamed protein product [Brassica oleracea]